MHKHICKLSLQVAGRCARHSGRLSLPRKATIQTVQLVWNKLAHDLHLELLHGGIEQFKRNVQGWSAGLYQLHVASA